MINLVGQYHKIKDEVDAAISQILESGAFINGPAVKEFTENLAAYLKQTSKCANSEDDIYVVPCANGTDALQIALMTLGLKPGDEVLVPAFTYVASAEVIGLLGLTPVMVDVDRATFNVTVENLRKGLSSKTKAIIPVHLFGQSCDMEPILQFALENKLFVIEDNAQAIGAEYTFSNGKVAKSGTMGVMFSAEGTVENVVDGKSSTVTLSTLGDMTSGEVFNLNLLTTLEAERTKEWMPPRLRWRRR